MVSSFGREFDSPLGSYISDGQFFVGNIYSAKPCNYLDLYVVRKNKDWVYGCLVSLFINISHMPETKK